MGTPRLPVFNLNTLAEYNSFYFNDYYPLHGMGTPLLPVFNLNTLPSLIVFNLDTLASRSATQY